MIIIQIFLIQFCLLVICFFSSWAWPLSSSERNSSYGTRCFYFYNYQTEWVDAERNCIALGANLASFHSHSEYIFLKNLVRAARGSWDRTWVGGYDAIQNGFLCNMCKFV
uniref:Galactose-specific lectin nattectin-like n=1 Tax=Xiphophorus maculatus TaxID=8083 RepID=A0A3B5QKD5_XIPMA